jgi:caffeoyl-CoA O-methyltransferase
MIVRPKVEHYAEQHSSAEPHYLMKLGEETRQVAAAAHMLTGRVMGGFLATMVSMARPRLILEIGTFTGYATLAMAAALPPGGRIVTCEIDEAHAAIARRHFATSPWCSRIDLHLGPAIGSVAALDGPFDFVFIDADKTNYTNYLELVLPKLDPRGIIVVDNVLWFGRVISEEDQSEDACAMRAFNEKVRDDTRLEKVMLTVREGVTLIRKAQQ